LLVVCCSITRFLSRVVYGALLIVCTDPAVVFSIIFFPGGTAVATFSHAFDAYSFSFVKWLSGQRQVGSFQNPFYVFTVLFFILFFTFVSFILFRFAKRVSSFPSRFVIARGAMPHAVRVFDCPCLHTCGRPFALDRAPWCPV